MILLSQQTAGRYYQQLVVRSFFYSERRSFQYIIHRVINEQFRYAQPPTILYGDNMQTTAIGIAGSGQRVDLKQLISWIRTRVVVNSTQYQNDYNSSSNSNISSSVATIYYHSNTLIVHGTWYIVLYYHQHEIGIV